MHVLTWCALFNFVGADLGGSTLKSEAKFTLALTRVTFNLSRYQGERLFMSKDSLVPLWLFPHSVVPSKRWAETHPLVCSLALVCSRAHLCKKFCIVLTLRVLNKDPQLCSAPNSHPKKISVHHRQQSAVHSYKSLPSLQSLHHQSLPTATYSRQWAERWHCSSPPHSQRYR